MRIFYSFIFICLSSLASAQRCGTPDYMRQAGISAISNNTSLRTASGSTDTMSNEVIIIPVVIHVIYNTSDQNISDAQVLSQIAVLNNDYRRKNADTVNTPAPFKSVAADAKIVFCVAKVDPDGRHTTGIIHKHTNASFFLADDEMKYSASGGDDAWDAKKYLNIWVCNLFGRTLGYAVMPGGPADKDGVVIQYNVFGTVGNVAAPYNKGRTATHEIGHWLGLRHLWGDAVCGDDGIADTPPQQASSSGCPSFPKMSTCSINSYGDMFMDFMDFTDDACMNMFTQDQKIEMRGQFAAGNARNSFMNNVSVCDSSLAQGNEVADSGVVAITLNISVYPNPFTSQINISYKKAVENLNSAAKLYDMTGKLLITQAIQKQTTIINVNALPQGIYILKVEGNNASQVFKLIK